MKFHFFEYSEDERKIVKEWDDNFPSKEEAIAWCTQQRNLGNKYSVCPVPIADRKSVV